MTTVRLACAFAAATLALASASCGGRDCEADPSLEGDRPYYHFGCDFEGICKSGEAKACWKPAADEVRRRIENGKPAVVGIGGYERADGSITDHWWLIEGDRSGRHLASTEGGSSLISPGGSQCDPKGRELDPVARIRDGNVELRTGRVGWEPLHEKRRKGTHCKPSGMPTGDFDGAWVRHWELSVPASVSAVAVDSNGAPRVGGSRPGTGFSGDDAYVIAFTPDGNRQWRRRFGNEENDEVLDVAVDGDGNVYAVGVTAGEMENTDPVKGETDAFLVKFDASGRRQWTRQFGGEGTDRARGVAATDGGDVYVAGETVGWPTESNLDSWPDGFLVHFEADGTRDWLKFVESDEKQTLAAVSASSETVVAGGSTAKQLHEVEYHGGRSDALVLRYDAAGERQWTTLFGGESVDPLADVTVAEDRIFVAGDTGSQLGDDSATEKLDGLAAAVGLQGEVQWTRRWGGDGRDDLNGVAKTDGRVVTGGTDGLVDEDRDPSTLNGGSEAAIVEYASDGSDRRVRIHATPDHDSGHDLAVGPDGAIFLVGTSQGLWNRPEKMRDHIEPDVYLAKWE